MRKQYHFWPAERGFDAWDVDRLIDLSRDLPVERVAVESIGEIDTSYWFDGAVELPTVRKVVKHSKIISGVDVGYPIILGHDGRVMDGMHRIARALLDGRAEIDAVRFTAPSSRTIDAACHTSCRTDRLRHVASADSRAERRSSRSGATRTYWAAWSPRSARSSMPTSPRW